MISQVGHICFQKCAKIGDLIVICVGLNAKEKTNLILTEIKKIDRDKLL